MTMTRYFSLRGALTIIFVVVALVFVGLLSNYREEVKALINAGVRKDEGRIKQQPSSSSPSSTLSSSSPSQDTNDLPENLPEILITKGIYSNNSFMNENGIIPSFWENEEGTNATNTIGPCYYDATHNNATDSYWEKAIEKYNAGQQPWYNEYAPNSINKDYDIYDLNGYCRPGFIIIGAGKCGTSSLYHYLTEHPRVLPASEKQIHYFRYYKHQSMKWYYNHFPSTTSFLAAGALMTGEASPGYLPYPQVVVDMEQKMKPPRLVVIGRNPIERSWSSYKYNYVDPHIEYLRKHVAKGKGKRLSDEIIRDRYLFSFEEMVRAELDVLKECFKSNSEGRQKTQQQWFNNDEAPSWIQKEYERRSTQQGIPSLLDLDGTCYGSKVNEKVLRKQWSTLQTEQPNKVILDRNTHLTQSLIGRSLYVFPLEWWYAAYADVNAQKQHIYFVCTEELQDFSGESLNEIGSFLGLPRYEDFGKVLQKGAYNVGGHKGYDKEISWNQINAEKNKKTEEKIPLSDELRQELEDFIRPYNEKLFILTGRRCNW